MPIDAQSLPNGIRRLPLGDLLPEFEPGSADLAPFAFARAIPAFVLSLIFCASTSARDESSASRILRTSSTARKCFRRCYWSRDHQNAEGARLHHQLVGDLSLLLL